MRSEEAREGGKSRVRGRKKRKRGESSRRGFRGRGARGRRPAPCAAPALSAREEGGERVWDGEVDERRRMAAVRGAG